MKVFMQKGNEQLLLHKNKASYKSYLQAKRWKLQNKKYPLKQTNQNLVITWKYSQLKEHLTAQLFTSSPMVALQDAQIRGKSTCL